MCLERLFVWFCVYGMFLECPPAPFGRWFFGLLPFAVVILVASVVVLICDGLRSVGLLICREDVEFFALLKEEFL